MIAGVCAIAKMKKTTGKRSAGNPHAAFEEGRQGNLPPTLLCICGQNLKPRNTHEPRKARKVTCN